MPLTDFLNSWFKPKRTDFLSDRLNYVWNSRLFSCLAIFIICKHIEEKPVECQLPPGYSSIHAQYVETQCISASSYFYVDRSLGPMKRLLKRDNREYYNGVPLDLLLMAVISYVSQVVWSLILNSYGDQTFDFIENGVENHKDIGNKENSTEQIVGMFEEIVYEWKDDGWFEGTRLTKGYLLSKVAYLLMSMLNIFLVLYQLNISLEEYLMIGTHLFSTKGIWEDDKMDALFPSAVTCKVEGYHALGHPSVDYTICTLNLSNWYRRVFAALFYTTAGMVVINFVSLVYSAIWTFSGDFRKRNIRFCLKEFKHTKYAHLLMNFVDDHLHADELLVLDILKEATKESVFIAVVKRAFEKYVIFKTGQDTKPNVVNEKTEEIQKSEEIQKLEIVEKKDD